MEAIWVDDRMINENGAVDEVNLWLWVILLIYLRISVII
jgi:hypothetical protein